MFLLGVIMFGVFATSFNNYSNFAESVTLDNNLDRVLQKISQEILSLLDQAAAQRGKTSTIDLSLKISLDSEYATNAYIINFASGEATLQALVNDKVETSLPLNLNAGNPGNVNLRSYEFSGQLSSSSINTQINYHFDGTVESITFTS